MPFPHVDEFQPVMWDTVPELEDERDTHGTIPLSHQGCGYYDLLVVNGPDAGHIWFDGRAADGPISPQLDDLGRVTFDRWYLTWLARAEELCAQHT